VSHDGGATFVDLPGAVTPTLTFRPGATDTGALYRAVFTNVAASVPSAAARLTLTPGLAVTADPVPQVATVGSFATFTAAATGTPSPRVHWQVSHDGGVTFSNIPGATFTTLRVRASGTVDGELFRAVFTNLAGSAATSPGRLNVTYHMTVGSRPKTLVVPAGTEVALTGEVPGLTTPIVTWEASTDGGRTYTVVPGSSTATLVFTAGGADSGRYFRAVFVEGRTVRRTAPVLLTVGFRPVVASSPLDATAFHGASVAFHVAVAGSPVVTIQWQVSTDGGKTFTNITGATRSVLPLRSVRAGQSGHEYRAVLTNAFGQVDSAAATLTVL
jgi:hypothetical protein